MSVTESKGKMMLDKLDRFGETMPDGRLTVASNGKTIRLREAIFYQKS